MLLVSKKRMMRKAVDCQATYFDIPAVQAVMTAQWAISELPLASFSKRALVLILSYEN